MMQARMNATNGGRPGRSGDALQRTRCGVALALALSLGWAVTRQELPPGPTAVHCTDFVDAHRFDVVQLILEFAPGAWTPWAATARSTAGIVAVMQDDHARRPCARPASASSDAATS